MNKSGNGHHMVSATIQEGWSIMPMTEMGIFIQTRYVDSLLGTSDTTPRKTSRRPIPVHLLHTPAAIITSLRLYSTKPPAPAVDMTPSLTHTDPKTGHATMVNVTPKPATHRTALAAGRIVLPPSTFRLLSRGAVNKKGDVLTVAQVAGIQAAKRTGELIPLCHPVPLTHVGVRLWLDEGSGSEGKEGQECCVRCEASVECVARTGVEMEALTAVSVALLTVFDMCKAVGKGMQIEGIRVLEKTGGKSGVWKWDGADEANEVVGGKIGMEGEGKP
ncbi:Molybdopterin cofactor biosynthesis C domain-containing protein [Jimgerdemannia flammicorona]|uniref:cyclic pyranopterin monophosphate synthase n=1 Tax=Jimgerdemannia flammicorona TaxID=994334 RepID=A0A433D812_9FUNG|nr:Molybdopterin cofactor biosynthesis C domain-containing protein [Jimgerdemannia flammicorona]